MTTDAPNDDDRNEPGADQQFDDSSFAETHISGPEPELQSTQMQAEQEHSPDRIGRYRILQSIGKGGMGQVFLAEQSEPVKRRVALKIIKTDTPTKEILARFEAERQALALMDHPNIAKVLDAGVTEDGRPYFAMELVKGVPITEYCDTHKLNPDERLGLFVQTCRAIQHAHQKGIVHRDIKPTNVLVADGDDGPSVKVIDFGLAKAVHESTQLTERTLHTQHGQIVGTLAYMSPEQAEMNALNVDTRTDVYSLGVLLYELLTGSTPISQEQIRKEAFDRILRLIREEDAPRPSQRLSESGDQITGISAQRKTEPKRLSVILKGDLDWIAVKALEKDRNRRYETASALGVDVERYLSGEPIEARPPSGSYRLKKFVARHRQLAFAVTALIACILIGTGVSIWFAVAADGARQVAVGEKEKADLLVMQKTELVADLEDANATVNAEAETNRHLLYIARMREAQRASEMGDFRRAGDILESQIPAAGKRDLRGVDWTYLWNRSHPHDVSIRTSNDEVAVTDIAFRPETTEFAVVTTSNIVICDRATGQEIRRTRPLLKSGARIRFSPDGRLLACEFKSNPETADPRESRTTLIIFDAESLDTIFEVSDSSDFGFGIWDMAFAPGQSALALGTASGGIHVLDLSTGQTKQLVPNVTTTQIQFAADGDQLIGLTPRSGLIIWDVATGEMWGSIAAEGTRVNCFDLSSDGRLVVAGHYEPNAQVTVWDLQTMSQLHEFSGHDMRVLHTVFSSDDQFILSGGADGFVRVWSVDDRVLVESIPASARLLALAGDDEQLATSDRLQIHLWNHWRSTETDHVVVSERAIPLAVSRDGMRWIGRRGETVCVYDRFGKQLHTLEELDLPDNGVFDLAAVIGDEFVIREQECLSVFDLNTAELRNRIAHDGGQKNLNGFSAPPESQSIATAGLDGTVRVWNRRSGRQEVKIDCQGHHTSFVMRVCLSPDARWLASSSATEVILWDIQTQAPRKLIALSGSGAAPMAFSSDGRLFAIGSLSEISVFSIPKWELLGTFSAGQRSMVASLVFSPDIRLLIAGGADGSTRVWDLEMQDQRLVQSKHQVTLLTQFSDDGSELVTAGTQSIRFWPVKRREIIERTID